MAYPEPDVLGAYETKYVIFLDLLGWSHAIATSADDPSTLKFADDVTGALGRIHAAAEAHVADTQFHLASPRYEFFSDSLVISVIYGQNLCWPEPVVLNACKIVARAALQCGFLVRGGVCRGKIRHISERRICFGPALLRAHELESKVAVFPRIVIDNKLLEGGTPLHEWFLTTEGVNSSSNSLNSSCIVNSALVKDDDAMYHVDFLAPDYIDAITHKVRVEDRVEVCNRINRADELCRAYLNRSDVSPAVKEKYEWLSRYATSVRSRYL